MLNSSPVEAALSDQKNPSSSFLQPYFTVLRFRKYRFYCLRTRKKMMSSNRERLASSYHKRYIQHSIAVHPWNIHAPAWSSGQLQTNFGPSSGDCNLSEHFHWTRLLKLSLRQPKKTQAQTGAVIKNPKSNLDEEKTGEVTSFSSDDFPGEQCITNAEKVILRLDEYDKTKRQFECVDQLIVFWNLPGCFISPNVSKWISNWRRHL